MALSDKDLTCVECGNTFTLKTATLPRVSWGTQEPTTAGSTRDASGGLRPVWH